MGSPTVFINNQMACRVMDVVVEKPGLAMGPANPIAMGCTTVLIGEVGMGGVGSAQGRTMSAAKKAGIPFCEKCLRAAAAEVLSQLPSG
jgi:hypothetical protein